MMPGKPVDLVEFEDNLRFSLDEIPVEKREMMLERYTTTYCEHPGPGSARLWLQCAASIHQKFDHFTQGLFLFFFSRLAQLNPGVDKGYRDLAQATANEPERAFICAAAQLAAGDVEALPFTPDETFPYRLEVLAKPVRHPGDLDYLWMEFFLTGNEAALRKIIEVLAWPDRTSARLRSAFTNPGKGILSFRRRFVAARLQRLLGIDIDRTTGEVRPDVDLDLHCALQPNYQVRTPAEFAKIRAALPFQFSQAEVVQIGTKFSACWSLASNLRHQRVRDVYDNAAVDLESRSRLRNDVLTASAQVTQVAPEADRNATSGSSTGKFTVLDWETYKGPPPVTFGLVLKTQLIAAGLVIGGMHLTGASGWVATLVMQNQGLAWIALPILIVIAFVAAAVINLYAHMLSRAGVLPATDANGKHMIVYVCDVPAHARSAAFYAMAWPLIMSLFALAAGIGGVLVPRYFQVSEYWPWFLGMFIGQWLLSHVPTLLMARRGE